jgi:poly-gamma-glutamate biosynthesis protein PgsC/CapC
MLTLTLVIGIVVSLAIAEVTGVVAGAIIAPGYIALLLDDPRALLAVGLAVVGTHVIVSALSPFLFLYGTRRLTVSILVGLVLAMGLAALRGELASGLLVWAGLGYVVPGLIAHQLYRQGSLPTGLALLIAAPLTRALSSAVVAVLP